MCKHAYNTKYTVGQHILKDKNFQGFHKYLYNLEKIFILKIFAKISESMAL